MPAPPRPVRELVRELREAIGISQEELGRRSQGALRREDVNKIETGRNRAGSDRVRSGLATALGLSRDEVSDLLDGRADVTTTLERIRRRSEGAGGDSSQSPLDVAIAYWKHAVTAEAARRVRAKAAGHEWEKQPPEWGQELRKAQQQLLEEPGDAAPPDLPPPPSPPALPPARGAKAEGATRRSRTSR